VTSKNKCIATLLTAQSSELRLFALLYDDYSRQGDISKVQILCQ